jgi:hypothetical protein
MRTAAVVSWLGLAFLVFWAAVGQAQTTQTVRLVPKPPETFRWADIAGNPYSSAFRRSYRYASAAVDVLYAAAQPAGTPFAGLLQGTGLKPNFAYQIKLEGKPELTYGTEGDEWANAQLGLNGRWWVEVRNAAGQTVGYGGDWDGDGDTDNADYLLAASAGFARNGNTFIFTGYLIVDWLVTDPTGVVVLHDGEPPSPGYAFEADSSLHVLWNTVLNSRTPGVNDTALAYYQIAPDNPQAYKPTSSLARTVGLYGEWEPGRATPGTLVLPDGAYRVKLVLTEESFHTADGNWASVLWGDIGFGIGVPPPPPDPGTGDLSGTVRSLRTGSAVRGATVTVTSLIPGLTESRTATTNAKGRFSFVDLTAGDWQVRTTAPGFAPDERLATVIKDSTVSLGTIYLAEP